MSPYSALYKQTQKLLSVYYIVKNIEVYIYKSYVLQYINLYAYYLVGSIELYTPLYSPLYNRPQVFGKI